MCERPFFVKSQGISVPCGYCPSCIKDRKMSWKMRLLHQLQYHSDAIFLTLTYSDDYLPVIDGRPTLCKPDFQKFMKRLRIHFQRDPAFKSNPLDLSYFMVGEYGESKGRPHYHAIIFGLSWDNLGTLVRYPTSHGWVTSSNLVSSLWTFGYNVVGTVTELSIDYVAGYSQKKLFGKLGKEFYGSTTPPYLCVSKGLGLEWLAEHESQVLSRKYLILRQFRVALPRYYRKKLNITADDYQEFFHKAYQDDLKEYTDLISSHLLNQSPVEIPFKLDDFILLSEFFSSQSLLSKADSDPDYFHKICSAFLRNGYNIYSIKDLFFLRKLFSERFYSYSAVAEGFLNSLFYNMLRCRGTAFNSMLLHKRELYHKKGAL
jgi:hypothetical protein